MQTNKININGSNNCVLVNTDSSATGKSVACLNGLATGQATPLHTASVQENTRASNNNTPQYSSEMLIIAAVITLAWMIQNVFFIGRLRWVQLGDSADSKEIAERMPNLSNLLPSSPTEEPNEDTPKRKGQNKKPKT